MLNIDSLILTSVGYEKLVIYVPHNYTGQEVLVFKMNPMSYAVGEVEVKGERPSVDMEMCIRDRGNGCWCRSLTAPFR